MNVLDAVTRFAKEHYELHLMDVASGRARAVRSPFTSYYADPFVLADGDATWVFFEEFHYPSSRGYIAAARTDGELALHSPARVLDLACHASFPFVFRDGGALFMLPETSHGRCVDLYACVEMPGRWRRAARLLEGVDCADSVLHRRHGLWYLITSESDERTSPNRWLAIYSSGSLTSGRWTPHPVNRERRYADRPHGCGRNAGALVDTGEHLLRPMQASTAYYGQAMRVMQVVELSESRFEEIPFEGEHLYCAVAKAGSTHHVSEAAGIVAWDTRTRAGYFGRPRRSGAPAAQSTGGPQP
ncbi:MAG: hypothetical protein JWO70_2228 [Betaproteobacteria bacterium]|nr:hypothetical protein [Betaproteobacteria bacterium]